MYVLIYLIKKGSHNQVQLRAISVDYVDIIRL